MNAIQNASEAWAGHSFQEVENYLKKSIGLYGAELVDMGLPSGRLWADRNIGAESETDGGLYFQWGDIEGFSKDSGRYCSGSSSAERSWTGDYARCHGSELGDEDNIPTDPYFDAARKNMGAPWRMPTKDEFVELFNSAYTTNEWVTNYKGSGMNGRLVTSKANGNKLFFPAAGSFNGGFRSYGSNGGYWSSSCYGSDGTENAYSLYFSSGNVNSANYDDRYCGYSVRGVQ